MVVVRGHAEGRRRDRRGARDDGGGRAAGLVAVRGGRGRQPHTRELHVVDADDVVVDVLVLLEVRVLRRLDVVLHVLPNVLDLQRDKVSKGARFLVRNAADLQNLHRHVVQHPEQRLQLLYVEPVLVQPALALVHPLLLVFVQLLLFVRQQRLDFRLERIDLKKSKYLFSSNKKNSLFLLGQANLFFVIQ